MWYFESETPEIRFYASGGELVKWVSVDGLVGWWATARESTRNQLLKAIEKGVGGKMREITAEEYEAHVKKASGRPLYQPEREHLAHGQVRGAVVPPSPNGGDRVAEVKIPKIPAQPTPVSEPESVPADPVAPVIRRRGRPTKRSDERPE